MSRPKQYLLRTEAAKYLGYTPMTLFRWHKTGKLKACKTLSNGITLYAKTRLREIKKELGRRD